MEIDDIPQREEGLWGLALDLASSTRIWNTLLTSREHQSEKYHLENPYWKTFVPAVLPLLDCPMDMRRHKEMEVTASRTSSIA